MDRFEAMRTLIAAVDGGSLSAASRGLRVPLPTVSRRVSDLETYLGTQLVVRTSRKLILTEAGTLYVASVRRVLDELGEAERAASGEYRAPRGELLVTAPIMFGKLHVAPIVHDFLACLSRCQRPAGPERQRRRPDRQPRRRRRAHRAAARQQPRRPPRRSGMLGRRRQSRIPRPARACRRPRPILRGTTASPSRGCNASATGGSGRVRRRMTWRSVRASRSILPTP